MSVRSVRHGDRRARATCNGLAEVQPSTTGIALCPGTLTSLGITFFTTPTTTSPTTPRVDDDPTDLQNTCETEWADLGGGPGR